MLSQKEFVSFSKLFIHFQCHFFIFFPNGSRYSRLFGTLSSPNCTQHLLCTFSCAATITSSSENDGSSLEWSKESSVRITGHHALAPATMRTETCSPVAEEEVPGSCTEVPGAIRNAATATMGSVASGYNAEGPVHYPTQNSSGLMMPRPNSVAGTVWGFLFLFAVHFCAIRIALSWCSVILMIHGVVHLVCFVCFSVQWLFTF